MGGQAELSSLPIRLSTMLSKFTVPLRGSICKMAAIVYRPSPGSVYKVAKPSGPQGAEFSDKEMGLGMALWNATKASQPSLWLISTIGAVLVVWPVAFLNAKMEDHLMEEAQEAYTESLIKQRLTPPVYEHMNILRRKFPWRSNYPLFQHYGWQEKQNHLSCLNWMMTTTRRKKMMSKSKIDSVKFIR